MLKNLVKNLKPSSTLLINETSRKLEDQGKVSIKTPCQLESIEGENKITSIIYDYWGLLWTEELIKLKLRVDSRKDLSGKLPLLDKIPINNDVVFVWNATSNGMSISNINFLKKNHKGLIISDLTSAVFVCNLPWNTLDVSVFSLQKALGAESQKGVAVLSPRALERIKSNQLKLFSLKSFDFLINTPSLMAFAQTNSAEAALSR